MNSTEKTVVIEDILMRAAEQSGDIAPAVMEIYYRRHPAAKASFEKHCLGQLAQLEGQMVENSVHCLMNWVESPSDIQIMLNDSVPHHNDVLQVPPAWYNDLIEVTAEVIEQTIPQANTAELAVWREVRTALRNVIDDCQKQIAARATRGGQ